MNRRFFMRGFGLAAVTAASATVAQAYKEETLPKKAPPSQSKHPYDHHATFAFHQNNNHCQLSVGEDGCLWVKPQNSNKWLRVAVEE